MIPPRFLISLIVAAWLASLVDANQMLHVQIRDGSKLVLDVAESSFDFFEIVEGQPNQRKMNWSQVAELKLVGKPVSAQMQQIERLLQQLTSADYETREQAETILSDAEKFGPFESVIRDAAKANDIESDYRLQRVFDKLEEYSGSTVTQFDELLMKDGSRLFGDARGLSIEGRIFGHVVRLDRKKLLYVSTELRSPPDQQTSALQMRTYNQAIPNFYADAKETFVSFEVDRFGEPIPIGANVNEMFTSEGLKFATESAGFVGAIKYSFNFCPIDAGNKCICPFAVTKDSTKRLVGTTIISFCLPGQSSVAAGVNKFGLFVERVEHSRDIVVEAYNAKQQMIGMVEASDQKCVFAGFQSNELITSIRISKNNDLPENLDREDPIDASYAIDCVTFGELLAIDRLYEPEMKSAATGMVTLNFRSGNSIATKQLELKYPDISFYSELVGQTIQSSLEDVESIGFHRARKLSTSENESLLVQLDDSSMVKTECESYLQPYDFLDSRINENQVVGIWSTNRPARLAENADFETKQPVIVYPSCRIVANDLELKANGFSWNADRSEKKVQNVRLFTEESDTLPETPDPDLTPDVDKVDFGSSVQIPTLWLSQPYTHSTGRGHVCLTDGQYFVLNGASGFRLSAVDAESIEISFGKSKKRYPLTRVSSIKFPDPTTEK